MVLGLEWSKARIVDWVIVWMKLIVIWSTSEVLGETADLKPLHYITRNKYK